MKNPTCPPYVKQPSPRPLHLQANDLWLGDVTYGIPLPDSADPGTMTCTALHLWADLASGRVPHAEFVRADERAAGERILKKVASYGGCPQQICTDNHDQYSTPGFRDTLDSLGIERLPPNRACLLRIERLFHILHRNLYPILRATNHQTLSDLNDALWMWLDQYNAHIQHRSRRD
jgi:hypothetical protein